MNAGGVLIKLHLLERSISGEQSALSSGNGQIAGDIVLSHLLTQVLTHLGAIGLRSVTAIVEIDGTRPVLRPRMDAHVTF